MASFLQLPPEVRETVYEHYFAVEGGYHFNHQTRRLRRADGSRIDFSLRFVCRLISRETWGIPLRANCITFSTGCNWRKKQHAKEFELIVDRIEKFKERVLPYTYVALTPRILKQFTHEWPEFTHVLQRILTKRQAPRRLITEFYRRQEAETWREIPSIRRCAIMSVLRTAAEDDWEKAAEAVLLALVKDDWRFPDSNRSPSGIQELPLAPLNIEYLPWAMPTWPELEEWADQLGEDLYAHGERNGPCPSWRYFHFSAAAHAIEFLRTVDARLCVRRITLCEDERSVVFPETHAVGLIPFCQENPSLRIERHVSLFSNLLQVKGDGTREIEPECITQEVGVWLVEALTLVPAGMPVGSFRLVLDCNGAPEKATAVFEKYIHRDVGMQATLEECYNQGIHQGRTLFEKRHHPCYILRDLPKAMELLGDNSCDFLTCTFDQGVPWDINQVFQERKGWTWEQWGEAWIDFPDLGFKILDVAKKRSVSSMTFVPNDLFSRLAVGGNLHMHPTFRHLQ